MAFFEELKYNSDIEKVVGVQFSVMSPDEIKRRSAAEIVTQETYGDIQKSEVYFEKTGVVVVVQFVREMNKNVHYVPVFLVMGSTRPVFYIHFKPQVLKTLRCICFRCSKLLIDPEALFIKNHYQI